MLKLSSIYFKKLFTLTLLLSLVFHIAGQSKSELEVRRTKLQKEIRETQSLIEETKSLQKNTLLGYQTIEAQLSKRNELIRSIQQELKVLNGSIQRLESNIDAQNKRIKNIQEKYSATLRNAYRIKLSQNPMLYIFSAENLNQALSRWNYLRQLDRFQSTQQLQINAEQDSLRSILAKINLQKEDKLNLQLVENEQSASMKVELKGQTALLNSLKSKESELSSNLSRKKKESDFLNSEIERIIKAEMATSTTDTKKLPNAPEMVALSDEFTQNKGKLPWPVSRGIISGKFGEQPHPVLKSIKIQNNGIDISAEKGAEVKVVFSGEVVGKKNIPGFDNMVIIRHGKYYTVYSKLAAVFVNQGDKLSLGDTIGRLSSDSSDAVVEFHFEVWQDKQQVNPEIWLN